MSLKVSAPMQSITCGSSWFATTLSPEGVMTSLSSRAEQFTGYSVRELLGKPITQILADPSAFDITRILDHANRAGHWEGEIVHRTREGKSLGAQSAVLPLAEAGGFAGFILVSALNRVPASVPEVDSALSEVGGKLRAFAHDLNNPLAVVTGFAQLLMVNSCCEGNMRADVEKLYSELKRVIQVVEELHQYATSLQERHGAVANS